MPIAPNLLPLPRLYMSRHNLAKGTVSGIFYVWLGNTDMGLLLFAFGVCVAGSRPVFTCWSWSKPAILPMRPLNPNLNPSRQGT